MGTVSDSSGSVMPNVRVSVTNDGTGLRRETRSNDLGNYAVPLLPPGAYRVTVRAEHFSPVTREGITLSAGSVVRVDFSLRLREEAASITVSSEVPFTLAEEGGSGMTLGERRIQEERHANRNALALAQLAANVNGTSEQAGRRTDFRINGGRTGQVEYFLDGVPVTTGYLHNVPPSVPSPEGVAEFKVLTNGLPAEYGRLSGGAVMVTTRSGSARFHGSAYSLFRHAKLNANDWNSNRFGRARGPQELNVPGFALGGPLRPGGSGRSRGKSFFFVNFEAARRHAGNNATLASVPTELERAGDFTGSLIDNRVPVRTFDPLTTGLQDGIAVRQPFPGNRIPASRYNALSRIYLAHLPLPNQAPRPYSSNEGNFIYSTSNRSSRNRWTGRLDRHWNDVHSTSGSLSWSGESTRAEPAFSALTPVNATRIHAFTAALQHVWTPNSNTAIHLRGGAVRNVAYEGSSIDVDQSVWPLQPEVRRLLGTDRARAVWLTGIASNLMGGGSILDERDNIYSGAVALQRIQGRHNWKAGFDNRWYLANVYSGGSFAIGANRNATARSMLAQETGAYFAGFLLGIPLNGTGAQYAGPATLMNYRGAYLQDQIKVSPRLAITAGLRWDYEAPRTERYDRLTMWDRDYRSPWQPSAGWNWETAATQVGVPGAARPGWLTGGIFGRVAMAGTKDYPGRTLEPGHPYKFSPRIGFAWSPQARTVVRGGWGINWLSLTGNWHLGFSRWNMGFGDFARIPEGGTPDGGLTYPLTYDRPMPNGQGYIPFTRDVEALNRSVMGNWFVAGTRDFSSGYEHTVYFSVQREFGPQPSAWALEASYSGNFGRSLPAWIGLGDHVLPDAYHKLGPLGDRLLKLVDNPFSGQTPGLSSRGGTKLPLGNLYQSNPLWQQISTLGDPLGVSNYNAAYLQAERRLASSFSLMANYTFGKLLQNCGGLDQAGPNQGFPQAGLGFDDVYGVAKTDMTHRLMFSYRWEIPGAQGRTLSRLTGGWSLAGAATYRSGTPVVVSGSNHLWWNAGQASSDSSERPVWVYPRVQYDPGLSGHGALEGAAGQRPYVNPAAFRLAEARPDLLEIGDVGSVLPQMRNPGFSQWDLSVVKKITLPGDGRSVQFRLEVQNVLNRMNTGNPGTDLRSRTFGLVTTQAGSPRVVAIGARLQF